MPKDGGSGNVRVFCRFRPLNQRELGTTGHKICCSFPNDQTVSLAGINPKTGQHEPVPFAYDRVYDMASTQAKVYETAVAPIVEQVLNGYNGTILAYGQTGSGKTHTMSGYDIDDDA
jgi:kinesin family protein 5